VIPRLAPRTEEIGRVPHVRTSVRGPKKMGEAHDRSSSTILQTEFLAGILFGRFASFSDMT
jgi:hypothetical protein